MACGMKTLLGPLQSLSMSAFLTTNQRPHISGLPGVHTQHGSKLEVISRRGCLEEDTQEARTARSRNSPQHTAPRWPHLATAVSGLCSSVTGPHSAPSATP